MNSMVLEDDKQDAVIAKVRGYGKSVNFNIDMPTDHIQASILSSNQFYEIDLLSEIFHQTMPGMRFVDVGANIGNHTLFFSGIAGMEGISFEPYKPNFLRLKKNVKINDLGNKVEVRNIALGKNAGKVNCAEIDTKNTGTISFVEATDGEVDMFALDDLMLDEFHFLKVDVEGMEVDVLKGARNTLSKYRPKIFCEAQTQQEFMELKNLLEGYRYRPTRRFCVTPTYLFEPV